MNYKGREVYRGTIPLHGYVRWGMIFGLAISATLLDPSVLNGLLAFLGSALIVSALMSGHGDKGSVRSPELREISWKPHVLYWRQRPFWTISNPFVSLALGAAFWFSLAILFALNNQLATSSSWKSIGFQLFIGLMLGVIAALFVDLTVRYWFTGKWIMRLFTLIFIACVVVAFYVFWRQVIPGASLLTQLGSLMLFICVATWSVDSIHRGLRSLIGQTVEKL